MSRMISIVGTGTEVGKTIVAAGLARAFGREGYRVGVFKPFACDPVRRPSGEGFSTDADLLARAAGLAGGAGAATGQLFEAPLAPFAAARMEGRCVDVRAALRRARRVAREFDLTLVEGCGGWEVPLTPRRTTADFFEALGAPVLIVARSGLGTLNHTLLTVRTVRARGLTILGVILNRLHGGRTTQAERTNPAILESFASVPIFGPVAFRRNLANRRPDRIKDLNGLPDLRFVQKKLCAATIFK